MAEVGQIGSDLCLICPDYNGNDKSDWWEWGIDAGLYSADFVLGGPSGESLAAKAALSGIFWKNAAKTSTSFAEGSFSVFNWKGYPAGGVKPTGPFRLLEGAEYTTARNLANKTNAAIHKANPQLKGLQIHEVNPVKFGGSSTDMSNKIFLTPSQHSQYTNFWNALMRSNK